MGQGSWLSRAAALLGIGNARTATRPPNPATNGQDEKFVRLVLDTEVLVAAARDTDASSVALARRATADGNVKLLVSPPVFREYRRLLPRALRSHQRETLVRTWLSVAEAVDAGDGPRVVEANSFGDKFVELARVGRADAIVTNDSRLLALHGRSGMRVLRPYDALRLIEVP